MVAELHALEMIRVVQEAAFGTDPGAGYEFFPIVEGSADLSVVKQRMHERGTSRQEAIHLPMIAGMTGASDGEFKFDCYLHSWSTTTPIAAPAALSTLAQILAACTGASWYGGFGAIDPAGSTDTVLELVSAASFRSGQMVCTDVGVAPAVRYDSRFAVGRVTGVPETVTVNAYHPFEAVPAAAVAVYGSINCFHWPKFLATGPSLTFLVDWEGESIELHGCRGKSFSLVMEHGKLPKLSFIFAFAGFGRSAASALATTAYTYPDPVEYGDACLRLGVTGVGGNEIYTDAVTVNYDNDLQPLPNPNTGAGLAVAEWVKGPKQSIKASYKAVYDDGLRALWAAQTVCGIEATHGRVPGQVCGFRLPAAYPIAFSPRQEIMGQDGVSWEFGHTAYTGDTDSAAIDSTVPGDKMFNIALA